MKASSQTGNEKAADGDGGVVFPDDILTEILLRVPATSILRLRSVCKSWHSLTSNPSFIQSHHRRAPPGTPIILTSFLHRIKSKCLDLHYINPGECAKATLRVSAPSAARSELLFQGSCGGLLCFREERPPRYHICNLASEDWTQIPLPGRHPYAPLPNHLAFYHHRQSGEHRLLDQIVAPYQSTAGFQVFSMGGSNWRPIESNILIASLLRGFSPLKPTPVSLRGSLHWVTDNGSALRTWILAFDTEAETLRKMSCPAEEQLPAAKDLDCQYVFEMRGNLGLSRFRGSKVELWSLVDYGREEWTRVHTISSQSICKFVPHADDVPFLWPLVIIDDKEGRSEVVFKGSTWVYDDCSGWLHRYSFLYDLKEGQARALLLDDKSVRSTFSSTVGFWTLTLASMEIMKSKCRWRGIISASCVTKKLKFIIRSKPRWRWIISDSGGKKHLN